MLDVRFLTTGCFYSASYEFSFTGGATATVAVVRLGRNLADLAQTKRTVLGSLSLTASDLSGLDTLLGFYRSQRSNRTCTTVDTVTFTHRRAGRVLATELFTDSTCGAREVRSVLTFSELVGRAGGYK